MLSSAIDNTIFLSRCRTSRPCWLFTRIHMLTDLLNCHLVSFHTNSMPRLSRALGLWQHLPRIYNEAGLGLSRALVVVLQRVAEQSLPCQRLWFLVLLHDRRLHHPQQFLAPRGPPWLLNPRHDHYVLSVKCLCQPYKTITLRFASRTPRRRYYLLDRFRPAPRRLKLGISTRRTSAFRSGPACRSRLWSAIV